MRCHWWSPLYISDTLIKPINGAHIQELQCAITMPMTLDLGVDHSQNGFTQPKMLIFRINYQCYKQRNCTCMPPLKF